MKKTLSLIALILLTANAIAQTGTLMPPYTNISSQTVNVSNNGKWLLAANRDAHLICLESGKILRSFATSNAYSAAFSPDDKQFALADGQTIKIFETASGRQTQSLQQNRYLGAIAWSKDGNNIAYLNENQLCVVNISSGQKRILHQAGHSFICPMEGGRKQASLRYSQSGNYILISGQSACAQSAPVLILDAQTGKVVKTFDARVTDFDLSSDDSKIALVRNNGLLRISSFSGERTYQSKTLRIKEPMFVRFSPDEKHILVSDVQSSVDYFNLEHNYIISQSSLGDSQVGFAGNEHIIGVSQYGGIFMYDTTNGLVRNDKFTTQVLWINNLNISEDGQTIMVKPRNKGIKLLNADLSVNKQQLSNSFHLSSPLLIPYNSHKLISRSGNHIVYFDIRSGQRMKELKDIARITNRLIFSNDGKKMILSSGSQYKINDLQTGELIYEFRNPNGWGNPQRGFDISPDNRYYASALKTERNTQTGQSIPREQRKLMLMIYDMHTHQVVRSIETPHNPEGIIQQVLFTRDGKYIFTDSNNDNKIYQWDMQGRHHKIFEGHIKRLSAKGNYLITYQNADAGGFETIVHHIQSGREAARIPYSGDSFSCADEKYLFINRLTHIAVHALHGGKHLLDYYFIGDEDWVALTPDGRYDGSRNGILQLHHVNGTEVRNMISAFGPNRRMGLIREVVKW